MPESIHINMIAKILNQPKYILLACLTCIFSSAFASDNTYDDKLIKERLDSMECLLDIQYNSTLEAYLKGYLVRAKSNASRILGRTDIYFPLFEKYLEEYGLPDQLKYLSVVESALNPTANSVVDARGLWQFMEFTAAEYDMQVNEHIDERLDPNLSTQAALRYLSKSFEKYESWELALASYNAGPGRVNRAIKRARSKKFSKVKRYLPQETQKYIPAFIAATYLLQHYSEHDIEPIEVDMDLVHTESILVFEPLHFNMIKRITGIDEDVLKRLNPSYLNDELPPKETGNYLILPSRYVPAIYDYLGLKPIDAYQGKSFQKGEVIDLQIAEHSSYYEFNYQLFEDIDKQSLSYALNTPLHLLESWNQHIKSDSLISKEDMISIFAPIQYVRFDHALLAESPAIQFNKYWVEHMEEDVFIGQENGLGKFYKREDNSVWFEPYFPILCSTLLNTFYSWDPKFVKGRNQLTSNELIMPKRKIRVR